MVHKIQVYEDKALKGELRTLATLQEVDEKLAVVKARVASLPNTDYDKYQIRENVLYCREGRTLGRWKAMLPAQLEQKVIRYVHLALGHIVVDKCVEEIKYAFYAKGLGRKMRKFVACYDVCQRTKHPNRSVDVEQKHHFPRKPGDVCAIDIYGNLPISRGVRYVLVCLDVFSRFVTLYALKENTTKSRLNRLINRYFVDVITPKAILSDNATQFRSPSGANNCKSTGRSTFYSG
jgi:transposase InsO family protein